MGNTTDTRRGRAGHQERPKLGKTDEMCAKCVAGEHSKCVSLYCICVDCLEKVEEGESWT